MWRQVQEREQQNYVKIAHMELLKQDLAIRKERLSKSQVALNEATEDVDLKVIISDKLEQARRSSLKQANNGHRVNLRNLLLESGMSVPDRLRADAKSSLSLRSGLVSSLDLELSHSSQFTPATSRTRSVITSTPIQSPLSPTGHLPDQCQ